MPVAEHTQVPTNKYGPFWMAMKKGQTTVLETFLTQ